MAGKEPSGGERVMFKSSKSSPGYEEYYPAFTIAESPRELIFPGPMGQVKAESTVKLFRGESMIVEICAPFNIDSAQNAIELKNSLHQQARLIAEPYGPLDLSEEYTFFTIEGVEDQEEFLAGHRLMVAQLVKDESAVLAQSEIDDALAGQLRYDVDDLAVVGWDGAVLMDKGGEFDDIIALVELANIQLLSLRALDARLTAEVKRFRQMQAKRAPEIIFQSRTLRSIIHVRTSGLFELEAIDNSIRLYGDWYAARIYALAERKLYLTKWRGAVEEKLAMLEKIFAMASHRQGEMYNITLETLIVLLIVVEIVLIVMGKI